MNNINMSVISFKINWFSKIFAIFCIGVFSNIPGLSKDLGKGFTDHGVTTPSSNDRGVIATVDGEGRDVVLAWLFDHRGGYAILMIDAETGKSQQFAMPFPPGDAVYSSILSSKNKIYTLFKGNFVEFDPVKRAFTFHKEVMPQMAMGMAEDDYGIIWAVTYPNSGVVSFNPVTQELKDYGYTYRQNWPQYPIFTVADDAGWVYWAIGNTASQILAFDPLSGKAKPMLSEGERKRGTAYVYRDHNGKVYGKSLKDSDEDWYEFYKGNGIKIGKHDAVNPKKAITGTQSLFHSQFPDGKRIQRLDLVNRKLTIEDPKSNTTKEVGFDYTSEGGWTMGVAKSPDGKLSGGTFFPMRFFSYDPKNDSWVNLRAFGQYNTLASQGSHFYCGSYPQGALIDWDTSKPWVSFRRGEQVDREQMNPRVIGSSVLLTHRPHRILPYTDGNTIIMSGTPEYGYTGGGLLFWDKKAKKQAVLQDSVIILDQSTMSMVALPKGKFLGGTTTSPGTGGERKAKEAELYIMDVASKKMEWHQPLIPGVQSYSDICKGPKGLIYGIADSKKFFVFDPAKREIIYQKDVSEIYGRTAGSQSPRIFVFGPKGEVYLLFLKGIVKVEPGSYKMTMVAESPVPIEIGGDYLDGRIYFVSGSHLCSYKLN
jgi:hypothetical protein